MSADLICRSCGEPFVPVQRGECSRCGSDLGAAPVVAPLPSAAVIGDIENEVWRWFNRYDAPWSPSYGTVENLARCIEARLRDRLVPEDDEDTVRVPREAVERLRKARDHWLPRTKSDADLSDAVGRVLDVTLTDGHAR